MSDTDDVRAVRCEACQAEGRIIRQRTRRWTWDYPDEVDCGECPACEGTGCALIEVEPVTEAEIMEPS